uniref:Uncharacterized protein n=1 Tax=Acrobeloides nanus TaxID=290746 RepID=A0A914EJE2_9BILA
MFLEINGQQITGSIKCYECASKGLQYRWDLTGLPRSLSDSAFMIDCDQSAGSASKVPCNGPCLTYIIQDPDNLTALFFVRGCQATLTQVQSTLNPQGFTNQIFCEYDSKFTRPNSLGQMVDTQVLAEFCSADSCNNKRTTLPGPNTGDASACSGQLYNYTIGNDRLNCYECSSNSWRCETGRCSKKYCMKSTVQMQGRYSTRRWCSDVNPFGVNEFCQSHDITVNPSMYNTISAYTTQCYCKDRQYCNGAISVKYTIFSIIIPIFVPIVQILSSIYSEKKLS